jgi:hypothetical protein
MKIPEFNNVTVRSISTIGVTGNILLAAILWGQISPYWLFLAVPLILSGLGTESRKN